VHLNYGTQIWLSKSAVYRDRPPTLNELKTAVTAYIRNISQADLQKVTLVDFQLDAQNSYLVIYNTFIKILYMFRALPCPSSGGCIHTQLRRRPPEDEQGNARNM
jgi:hypothetical protein